MKRLMVVFLIWAGLTSAKTISQLPRVYTFGSDSTIFIVDWGNYSTIQTSRLHLTDFLSLIAGNGLIRSGNTLAINAGGGLTISGDVLSVNTQMSLGTKIESGKVAVAYGMGLTTDATGLRPDVATDSAMAMTAFGKLYPKIDKEVGLTYSSGRITLPQIKSKYTQSYLNFASTYSRLLLTGNKYTTRYAYIDTVGGILRNQSWVWKKADGTNYLEITPSLFWIGTTGQSFFYISFADGYVLIPLGIKVGDYTESLIRKVRVSGDSLFIQLEDYSWKALRVYPSNGP